MFKNTKLTTKQKTDIKYKDSKTVITMKKKKKFHLVHKWRLHHVTDMGIFGHKYHLECKCCNTRKIVGTMGGIRAEHDMDWVSHDR